MPMIRANGTALYYEDTGGTSVPVVFSHGLLWDTKLFAPQIAVLRDRYRCIAYDHRGQGRSADDTGRVMHGQVSDVIGVMMPRPRPAADG